MLRPSHILCNLFIMHAPRPSYAHVFYRLSYLSYSVLLYGVSILHPRVHTYQHHTQKKHTFVPVTTRTDLNVSFIVRCPTRSHLFYTDLGIYSIKITYRKNKSNLSIYIVLTMSAIGHTSLELQYKRLDGAS